MKTNVKEAGHPYWSRDGRWIYFRGYQDTSRQIYRCPAEGGDAKLLVETHDLSDVHMESDDGKTLFSRGPDDLFAGC
ncbi:MAG: hypothetical protein WA823_04840 [Candidatus Acidiferrales bacterium]